MTNRLDGIETINGLPYPPEAGGGGGSRTLVAFAVQASGTSIVLVIPANTLANDGDCLMITGWGITNSGPTPGNLVINYGNTRAQFPAPTSNKSFVARCVVSRDGAAAQHVSISASLGNSATTEIGGAARTGTRDNTIDQNLTLTQESSSGSGLAIKGLIVELLSVA